MIKLMPNEKPLMYQIEMVDKDINKEKFFSNMDAEIYGEKSAKNIFEKKVSRNEQNKQYKTIVLRLITNKYRWYTLETYRA
jgi:hypothetical protein